MTRAVAPRTRAAALAGAGGAVFFLASFLFLSLHRPDIDPHRHFVSEMALGPGGHLVMGALFVHGVGLVFLANGIRETMRPSRTHTGLVALVITGGVGIAVAGLLPTDRRGAAHTEIGFTHGIVAGIAFTALVAAAILFAVAVRRDPRWHATSEAATALGTFAAGAYAVYMALFFGHWMDLFAADAVIGAAQRAVVAAGLAWVLFVAGLVWHRADHDLPGVGQPTGATDGVKA